MEFQFGKQNVYSNILKNSCYFRGMKSNKISFLCFYVVLASVFTGNAVIYSQSVTDSTYFYYGAITQVKDVKAVSNAFKFFEKKADAAIRSKDMIGAAYCFELISLGQFNLGFFYESESSAIRALKLLDAAKSDSNLLEPRKRLMNQLGMLYRRLEDFNTSNRFYSQALAMNTDVLAKISIINNMANNFGDLQDYDKAVAYLEDYYDEVITLSDTLPKAIYLDNLGYYQSKTGDSSALLNMQSALTLKEDIGHLPSIFSSYRHLSLYYLDRDDALNAKKYAAMAGGIADSLNIPDYQLEALALQLQLENDLRFNEYIELNSRIDKANKSKAAKFAAITYDFQKSELKLKASAVETERQQKIGLIYLLIGSVILLVSTIFYVYLKGRHKKEKIQQVFNTETRISKKIHDELANDMSGIMNYVENDLETSPETKTKLLTTLQDVYVRTRDISTETGSIDFVNFSESLKYLLSQHNKPQIKIIVNSINTIDWNRISDHKKLAIYRGLQELMVNMKKHSQAGLVTVVFKSHNNKNEIWYTDDGQGCSFETIHQSGLRNAESRIKDIGGTLTFETSQGNGFKAIITFYN